MVNFSWKVAAACAGLALTLTACPQTPAPEPDPEPQPSEPTVVIKGQLVPWSGTLAEAKTIAAPPESVKTARTDFTTTLSNSGSFDLILPKRAKVLADHKYDFFSLKTQVAAGCKTIKEDTSGTTKVLSLNSLKTDNAIEVAQKIGGTDSQLIYLHWWFSDQTADTLNVKIDAQECLLGKSNTNFTLKKGWNAIKYVVDFSKGQTTYTTVDMPTTRLEFRQINASKAQLDKLGLHSQGINNIKQLLYPHLYLKHTNNN